MTSPMIIAGCADDHFAKPSSRSALIENAIPLSLHNHDLLGYFLQRFCVNTVQHAKISIVEARRFSKMPEQFLFGHNLIGSKRSEHSEGRPMRVKNVDRAYPKILSSLSKRWSTKAASQLFCHFPQAAIKCVDARFIFYKTFPDDAYQLRPSFAGVIPLVSVFSSGKRNSRNPIHIKMKCLERDSRPERFDGAFRPLVQNRQYCDRTLTACDRYLLICLVNLLADANPGNSSSSERCDRTNQGLIAIEPKLEAPNRFINLRRFECCLVPADALHADLKSNRREYQERRSAPRRPAPQLTFAHEALEHARPSRSQVESVAASRASRIATEAAE
ncbi:hypothetical protein WYO_3661 [Methylobacterium sp. GXF4]|nr:hypothetical protein WYO_3661 [Methylobacterium sp. GXF4]